MVRKKAGRKPGRTYSSALNFVLSQKDRDALDSLAEGRSRLLGRPVSLAEITRQLVQASLKKATKDMEGELAKLAEYEQAMALPGGDSGGPVAGPTQGDTDTAWEEAEADREPDVSQDGQSSPIPSYEEYITEKAAEDSADVLGGMG